MRMIKKLLISIALLEIVICGLSDCVLANSIENGVDFNVENNQMATATNTNSEWGAKGEPLMINGQQINGVVANGFGFTYISRLSFGNISSNMLSNTMTNDGSYKDLGNAVGIYPIVTGVQVGEHGAAFGVRPFCQIVDLRSDKAVNTPLLTTVKMSEPFHTFVPHQGVGDETTYEREELSPEKVRIETDDNFVYTSSGNTNSSEANRNDTKTFRAGEGIHWVMDDNAVNAMSDNAANTFGTFTYEYGGEVNGLKAEKTGSSGENEYNLVGKGKYNTGDRVKGCYFLRIPKNQSLHQLTYTATFTYTLGDYPSQES
ncbi:hypothetical protein H9L19_03280 [Weissella diestrammenae]|uniref:WxL domain-containing protein n=1 Tax=Weissella diestrammenae TaxID=1162633 RepID=A0A7G9T720_9LACO|nr:hypothetical protein [Weissella diestrammenae]MCM0582508.1 hypothetical protein [Weissella diestrammenae]QNN75895.1 hypothetical protein H9L19_03280 [Weissella diestrammenae]